MPRGQYQRKTHIAPSGSTAVTEVAVAEISTSQFAQLAWWNKLNEQEQNAVVSEGKELAKSLLSYGRSRIAIGEHLTKLQGILEPHNLFGRFLKSFHFSKRTAYRYIAGFKNARTILPEAVLEVAMSRGYNMIGDSDLKPLGVYTEAVRKLPPPVNPDPVQAETWLNQVEEVRRQDKSDVGTQSQTFDSLVPQDPSTLLKESYRFISIRYKRLPNNSKVKAQFVRTLVGMILTELGVSGPQTFSPLAVPEDFRAQRGRPRTATAAA